MLSFTLQLPLGFPFLLILPASFFSEFWVCFSLPHPVGAGVVGSVTVGGVDGEGLIVGVRGGLVVGLVGGVLVDIFVVGGMVGKVVVGRGVVGGGGGQ